MHTIPQVPESVFLDNKCLDDHSPYSITCIQRPPMGSNKSGLLQQVVFTSLPNDKIGSN